MRGRRARSCAFATAREQSALRYGFYVIPNMAVGGVALRKAAQNQVKQKSEQNFFASKKEAKFCSTARRFSF